MKTLICSIFIFLQFCLSIYAQVTTLNPSCRTTIAFDWTIEKITVTDSTTIVDLKFSTHNNNFPFWVSSGMYIQDQSNPDSKKYYIKEFVGNELNKKYSMPENITYHYTWIFENIPKGLTRIQMLDPDPSSYPYLRWWDITINNPSSSSLSNYGTTNPDQLNTITDTQNSLNTLIYVKKTNSEKVLMAKLIEGKVYLNTATTNTNSNPKWTVLMNYDNTSTIHDLNNVAIMSYNGNNYRIINGFSADGQGNRQYLYSNGFKLENNVTALAQFCGGQKFVIEKSQSGNLYYIKFPSNYYYDSNFDDIKNTQSNLSFEIVNSKSLRNDFAIIFFLLKFSKSDTDPCE